MIDSEDLEQVSKLQVLKQFIIKDKTMLAWLLVVTLFIFGVFWQMNQYNVRQKKANQNREEFSQRQIDGEKAYNDNYQKQQALLADDHFAAQDLYIDASSSDFVSPSCERLEGREAVIINSSSCNYSLVARGSANMAIVFLYENQKNTSAQERLTRADPNDNKSLSYIETYMNRESRRYGVTNFELNLDFYGPYKITKSTAGLYYRKDGYKFLEAFVETSQENQVPEKNYDMVQYIKLDETWGGVAFPGDHRAFTLGDNVGTVAHEMLHLYGARDKYYNNDCSTVGGSDPFERYTSNVPGKDIMCSNYTISSSIINDITAREIGWEN